MADYVLAFIMAGGRGTRLKVLTNHRTKPAVGIAGKYRIFDFVATNVKNSEIPVMIVATQFRPLSLIKHIGTGSPWDYDFRGTADGRVIEINQPHEKDGDIMRFEGTADSVRKSMNRIKKYNPGIILILGGDHVYQMNYENAIKYHSIKNSDAIIMASPITEEKVSDFGIMRVDESGKILDFTEKPNEKEVIEKFRLTKRIKQELKIDDKYQFLASMGNYIFSEEKLKRFLGWGGNDFGRDVIPQIKEEGGDLYAYPYQGYWRDVGQVNEYYDCQMEFLAGKSSIDLEMVKTTYRDLLKSAKIGHSATVSGCFFNEGDEILSGSKVNNCIFGYQVIVDNDCIIKDSIFLGADRNYYWKGELKEYNSTFIGNNSTLKKVIFDKNVKIGKNVNLSPDFGSPKEREENLESVGLIPYGKDGKNEGDFYIDPESNILVIGKQTEESKKELTVPDNFTG